MGQAFKLPATFELWRVVPRAKRDSARRHADVVLRSFQDSGDAGAVSRYDILRRYPEICFMNGLVPLTDKEICTALGRRCAKPRKKIDMGNGQHKTVIHYVIPFSRADPATAPVRSRPRLAAAA